MALSPEKLTFLVAPCNEAGHLNACTGTSLAFHRRGHRVIFVIHEAWKGHPAALGFEEVTYTVPDPTNQSPLDKLAKMLQDYHIIGPEAPKQKLKNFVTYFEPGNYEKKLPALDNAVKAAIEKYRPDVCMIDDHALVPAIYYSGIPWIRNSSMGPLFETFDPYVPPGGSGLSLNSDRAEWPEYNQIRRQLFVSKRFNDFVETVMGYPRYPEEVKFPPTELITVYATPDELNFQQVREHPNWLNLEAFHKWSPSPDFMLNQSISKSFLDDQLDGKFSGRLIYFSLGSLASIDVVLMKRLVGVLGQTNHKYIVSKGPNADHYSLGPNMWGARYLPQTSIVPHVDLVITHGGNNTVTETFAMGKPMIVLPLFIDQYDNAQRLADTGYGVRIDPYNFEDQQLLEAIERMLSDTELSQKMERAGKRIQATNAHEALALKVEQLMQSRTDPV